MRRMFSVFSVVVGLTSLLALATPQTLAQKLDPETQLQEIARQLLRLQFEFDPVFATEMGEYAYNGRYPDYSDAALKKMVRDLEGVRRQLRRIEQSKLSVDAKIDYLVLESYLNSLIDSYSGSLLITDNPKLFSSAAVNGIFLIEMAPSLTEEEKLNSLLARFEGLSDLLSKSRKRLSSPPEIWVILAREEAQKGIDFFSEIAGNYSQRFPERRSEINAGLATATTALQDFIDFLDNFRDRPGKSFSLGKTAYDRKLKNEYFLSFDSDSLLKLGEYHFAVISNSYDSLAALLALGQPNNEFNVFVPKSFLPKDVLDYYRWEIAQARRWVKESEFASVPSELGECLPIETPPFLSNVIGGVAYLPAGPLEVQQVGRFFVQPIPDSLTDADRAAYFRYCYRRGFRPSVVHEAYPGHHLQLQMAALHPSLVRRAFRNDLMMEGWALYCEQAVYEHGYYGDDRKALLGILGGLKFRAARVIVDVKLHTGLFNYEQAVDWMVKNLGGSLEYIEKEVNRYTLSPTQPMTYFVGRMFLLDTRDLYREQNPSEFSIQAFHDMILSEGAVSPVLIRKKVLGQIL